jgi:hypothetical protein
MRAVPHRVLHSIGTGFVGIHLVCSPLPAAATCQARAVARAGHGLSGLGCRYSTGGMWSIAAALRWVVLSCCIGAGFCLSRANTS